MATATLQAMPTGLTGLVIAASDVTGQPDVPLRGQMLLAIPLPQAPEILGLGSLTPSDHALRFLKTNIPRANPAIAVTRSDAAGNYALHLDPGEYVLCLADSQKAPADFPATTRGCGRTYVSPGTLRRLDISSGFGEIVLLDR